MYIILRTRFVHIAQVQKYEYCTRASTVRVGASAAAAEKRTYVRLVQSEWVRAVVEQFDGVSGLVQQRRLDAELFFQEMRYALVQLRGVAGHQVGDQSQRRFHGGVEKGRRRTITTTTIAMIIIITTSGSGAGFSTEWKNDAVTTSCAKRYGRDNIIILPAVYARDFCGLSNGPDR